MTRFFRFIADTFFVDRYGHRAVVLETVAGVPALVVGKPTSEKPATDVDHTIEEA